MIKGTTNSGFEYSINEDDLNDMEFIDTLVDIKDNDFTAFSKLATIMLGKEQKQRLYDFLKEREGKVRIDSFVKEMTDILSNNEAIKN